MLNRKLNVILNGGLGNQLFIYCAAKTFAELNNINKVINYKNISIGIPLIREKRGKGTMASPWPPMTRAEISLTE